MTIHHLSVQGGLIVVEVPDDAVDTMVGSTWLHRFLNMGGHIVRVEPRTIKVEPAPYGGDTAHGLGAEWEDLRKVEDEPAVSE